MNSNGSKITNYKQAHTWKEISIVHPYFTGRRKNAKYFKQHSRYPRKEVSLRSPEYGGVIRNVCRSQWPRGLRRRSAAARLLRSWVWKPSEAWMFVCCECCVLSGRGLCDELITRPEESYRLWCVVVCDLESSWMRRPWPTGGCCAKNKQTNNDDFITYLH